MKKYDKAYWDYKKHQISTNKNGISHLIFNVPKDIEYCAPSHYNHIDNMMAISITTPKFND